MTLYLALAGLVLAALITHIAVHRYEVAVVGGSLLVFVFVISIIGLMGTVRAADLMMAGPFFLGLVVLTFALVGLPFEFIRNGARPGHCPTRDHNVTRNVSGRCPECGRTIPAPPFAAPFDNNEPRD